MKGKELIIAESDGCRVYQFRNETGEETITLYEVFPGVALAYNDFHMQYYNSEFKPKRHMFCVDHCREGRLEYSAAQDAFSYVEAGDLKLDQRLSHTGQFEMPLSHYYGAMIAFDMDIACRNLSLEVKDFPVDLRVLQEKFCSDVYPTVIHGANSIEHIFSELYAVPEKSSGRISKLKFWSCFYIWRLWNCLINLLKNRIFIKRKLKKQKKSAYLSHSTWMKRLRRKHYQSVLDFH